MNVLRTTKGNLFQLEEELALQLLKRPVASCILQDAESNVLDSINVLPITAENFTKTIIKKTEIIVSGYIIQETFKSLQIIDTTMSNTR